MTTEQPYPPIADYALVGDCHSAALVSRDGSIDWCCFHRFDARPVFSRILDWSRGGHFRVAPVPDYETRRRYLPGTNILEMTFETQDGVLVVTDCFPVHRTIRSPEGGPVHPYHQLIRKVRCTEGKVAVAIEFRPRFDYGTTVPRLELRDEDLAFVYGGADALLLQSDLPVAKSDFAECGCESELTSGDEATLVLTYALPHELQERRTSTEDVAERLEETKRFWCEWSDRCTYEGRYREEVVRSALTLKALTNAPTGAIVAAPTTSLPEEIGGVRNWDYRYTWLRDASFTLDALFTLGYTSEAHEFMQFVKRTTAGRAEELQVLYGVGGEQLLHEFELTELDGYRGSRPVRVGNAAMHQFQLDLYGELLDTAWLYREHGGEIDEGFWELLQDAADVVLERWEEPDEGIWEVRSDRKHFVYSKVMACTALDRATRLAEALGTGHDTDPWTSTTARIRERVFSEGVDPDTNAFVREFGSRDLDASALLIPIERFVEADDPRVRATVEQIEKHLTHDGLVHRYRDADDGLPGGEGAFLICSFWLVDNWVMLGEHQRARDLFEHLCGFANDVGLLSEEVHPGTGELLGNFPQAFSHVGLINSAIALATGEPER